MPQAICHGQSGGNGTGYGRTGCPLSIPPQSVPPFIHISRGPGLRFNIQPRMSWHKTIKHKKQSKMLELNASKSETTQKRNKIYIYIHTVLHTYLCIVLHRKDVEEAVEKQEKIMPQTPLNFK